MTGLSVRDIALGAHQAERARRDAERAEIARRNAEEAAAADEATLVWVHDPARSILAQWFPSATWVLVDRHFPQGTAVVHPDDDPDLLLIVTENRNYAQVPSGSERGPGWLVGASSVNSPAHLGQLLADRARTYHVVKEG